jgi:RNA polymerase sigma factor (sigma-70 family)
MAPASLGNTVSRLRQLLAGRPGSELDDGQLLHAFAARNDQAAFAALVRRHGPLVFGVCRNVLRHEQDAEDAFQATFLTLARKAGSIRNGEALAGWLHRVARCTALKVRRGTLRRRVREERAQPAPPPVAWDVAWREVQAVLDEEIQRLPAIYRDVFILCCMEGCGRIEAARQLGLKEGTVASRLAKARQRLQDRLTRRGLALSSVLAACSLSHQASAARTATLVRPTVEAAVNCGALPARLAALLPRTPARYKVVGALVLTLGLMAAGAGVLAQRPAPQAAAREQPAPKKEETPAQQPALVEEGERITVRGRVLDPDGKPFAGADLCLGWYRGYAEPWWPGTVEPLRPAQGGKSGPDGRFSFTLTKKEFYARVRTITAAPWRQVQVLATAKGYAPGWRYITTEDRKELTIQLVRDDAPVRGRVVDLQGRPVAGARVWLGHVTAGNNFLTINAGAGLPAPVRTDKDGCFVLGGIGRGRKVMLHIAAPTIEHKLITVDAGAAPVEVIAAPTKLVEGTVLARDTGKPLAGVMVFGDLKQHRGAVRAVTDARGRYRLVGLPKQARYEVTFDPVGQPYLSAVRVVAGSEGLKPIPVDSQLYRGVPVRFRLIDKETRRPVRARAQYTPLKTNPLYGLADHEGMGLVPNRVFDEVHTPDAEQCYQFTAYPGPGVIIVFGWYSGRTYLADRFTAAEKKKGLNRIDPHLGFVDLGVGHRFLDLAPADKPVTFDIELDPGRTVTGSLLGPDGKPVAGATACGLTYHPHHMRGNFAISRENQVLQGDTFTAVALEPEVPRTLTFVHKARKLIGQTVLKGEKAPLVVRLQPWGELTGRLVDAAGKPLGNVGIWLRYPPLPAPGLNPLEKIIRTDGQGRFRVEGLLPGLEHEITLRGEKRDDKLSAGAALQKLVVASGEVKDLGDIRVTIAPAPKKEKSGK